MKQRAVAQVLEHMRHVGKGCDADPLDAFAAHMRDAHGMAIHCQDHAVAADAAAGDRSFRNHGRAIVRAAGTKEWQAPDALERGDSDAAGLDPIKDD